MRHEVGCFGECAAAESRRAEYEAQDALHRTVYVAYGESSAADGIDYGAVTLVAARLDHVVACGDLRRGVEASAPVGHDGAVVSPLVAQDIRQQLLVLGGVTSVDVVVRCHYGPRRRAADGIFEVAQIQLAQGALRDSCVVGQTVDLLIVDGEVLDRRSDAGALHPVDICGGRQTRQQRVLGVVLEVAAAERVALQIDARRKKHVDAVLAHLVAYGRTHAAHGIVVPCRREQHAYGEARAVERALVALAAGRYPQPGRAVGQHDRRYAQTLDGVGRAGGSGDDVFGVADDGALFVAFEIGAH